MKWLYALISLLIVSNTILIFITLKRDKLPPVDTTADALLHRLDVQDSINEVHYQENKQLMASFADSAMLSASREKVIILKQDTSFANAYNEFRQVPTRSKSAADSAFFASVNRTTHRYVSGGFFIDRLTTKSYNGPRDK